MILGISSSPLSQYENGVNIPNDMMKVQIANYFDITIDYLVGRSDIKRYPSTNKKQYHKL